MDAAFFEKKKETFTNGPIKYLVAAGIVPEIIEERHVKLRLPAKDHFNHVGMIYAGSEFVIAEAAGGNLFVCTYGGEKYAPIIAGVEAKYLAPAKSDLFVELSLSEEEAAEKIAPIDERGRGKWPLEVPVYDAEGNHVCQFNFTYYAIPAQG